MFESTTEIVSAHPITVIALLPALYGTWRIIRNVRRPLAYGIGIATAIGLFPVFVLFVIGEFTGANAWTEFGTGLFQFEASIAVAVVRLYDAVLAAWLRVVVVIVEQLLSISVFQPETWTAVLKAIIPGVSGALLWITVFALHFTAGVVLVYGLHRKHSTAIDTLLHIGGAALLLAGMFVGLLQGQVGVGDPVTGVLLMAVIGLQAGVTAVLVGIKPDFSGESDDDADVGTVVREMRESVVSRLGAWLKQVRHRQNVSDE